MCLCRPRSAHLSRLNSSRGPWTPLCPLACLVRIHPWRARAGFSGAQGPSGDLRLLSFLILFIAEVTASFSISARAGGPARLCCFPAFRRPPFYFFLHNLTVLRICVYAMADWEDVRADVPSSIQAEPAEYLGLECAHLGDVQYGPQRGAVREQHAVVRAEHPVRV